MEGIGTGGKACHHTVQQPRQADAHTTTDPTQRDALTPQVGNPRTLHFRHEVLCGRGLQLALAGFTWMLLFAVAGMTVFSTALIHMLGTLL
jgi:hypothetical protein